jgi:hypothetical protein
MRKLRVILDSVIIEAQLSSNSTAETIYGTLPLQAEGTLINGEIVIPSPVYAPLVDGARQGLVPGDIAFRTGDQSIVIACAPFDDVPNGQVCMASVANVFAHAVTDLQDLHTLPARFKVKVEAA